MGRLSPSASQPAFRRTLPGLVALTLLKEHELPNVDGRGLKGWNLGELLRQCPPAGERQRGGHKVLNSDLLMSLDIYFGVLPGGGEGGGSLEWLQRSAPVQRASLGARGSHFLLGFCSLGQSQTEFQPAQQVPHDSECPLFLSL